MRRRLGPSPDVVADLLDLDPSGALLRAWIDAEAGVVGSRTATVVSRLAPAGTRRRRWWHAFERRAEGRTTPSILVADERPVVVFVDDEPPSATRDAGSLRLVELVRAVARTGRRVVVLSTKTEPSIDEVATWSSEGVVLAGPDLIVAALRASVPTAELVVVARPDNFLRLEPVIRQLSPTTPLWYDTIDLHFVRTAEQAALTKSARLASWADRFEAREITAATLADGVITVSVEERDALRQRGVTRPVVEIATLHEPVTPWLSVTGRRGLLFVGNFHHAPNADAATWLAEVWPLLRARRPGETLTVVGAHLAEHHPLRAMEGVDYCGYVESLDELYRAARVVLAPLRFGAGVKGKVTEAALYGVPVVGTTTAAAGLPPDVVSDTQRFADLDGLTRALALLDDDQAWLATATRARERVAPLLSGDDAVVRLVAAVENAR